MPKSDRPKLTIPLWDKALWYLVALTVAVTPLVLTRGAVDVFRAPKTVVFQTLALLIFAFASAAMLLSDRVARSYRDDRVASVIAVSAVLWTTIVSFTSVKPLVSLHKPLSVLCLAVFFLATVWLARIRGKSAVVVALAPAVVNALVAIGQSFGKWTLVSITERHEMRLLMTALVGNVNDVGGYFVVPLVAAIAGAIAWKNLRVPFVIAAALIGAGIVVAQSVASMAAAACAVAAMVFLPGQRRIRWLGGGAVAVLIAALALHPGSRARLTRLLETARTGNLSQATSFRLPAYAVALRMFQERPLLGMGPGVYGALYMPYKLRIDSEHPVWIEFGNQNFGEVHNDHLQLLAETGLFGYALFLFALVHVAKISFARGPAVTDRQRFARAYALPAAAGLFTLALGHFPLQLTSTTVPAAYLSALCFAWKDGDESA